VQEQPELVHQPPVLAYIFQPAQQLEYQHPAPHDLPLIVPAEVQNPTDQHLMLVD
jgi:hypothetical protein